MSENTGYQAEEIADLRQQCLANGANFIQNDDEPQTQQFRHFLFVGQHEGQEVVFDAVIYTLEMLYISNLYEIAEDRAKEEYPDHKPWELVKNENGELVPEGEVDEEIEEFKASIILELEEDDEYKVQELVNIDTNFDYGIGLEIALNYEEITDDIITKFITEFNDGTLHLDETLYSFEIPDEDDEEDQA